jgi:hypothetical protein
MADIFFSQSNPADASRFRSFNYVHVPLGGNRHLITCTGIVIIDYKGETSDAWRRDKLHLSFPIPELPAGQWLNLDYWAPFLTINAIFNQDQSINAGWAVDEVGLEVPQNRTIPALSIVADIAVRDSDGWLYRVGYNVTVSGQFVSAPPGPG